MPDIIAPPLATAVAASRHSHQDFLLLQHENLADRYSALAKDRGGQPVYAIEHGLAPVEVERLRRAVGTVLRNVPVEALKDRALPLIVVAAETGYTFTGLWTGYWPLLRSATGLDLSPQSRAQLTDFFDRAALRYGLKRPNDTPFARSFRHIAWPIANALAPRQLHGAIATMLRDVALLVGLTDDASFVRALRNAATRAGSDRLVEWASDEPRLLLLADALLRRESGREALSPGIVERLLRDLESVPGAQAKVVEARQLLERTPPPPKPARLVITKHQGSRRLKLKREPSAREDRHSIPAIVVDTLADIPTITRDAGLALRGDQTPLAHVFLASGEEFVSWARDDGPIEPDCEIIALAHDLLPKHGALEFLGSCAGGELYRINGPGRADLLGRLGVPIRTDGIAIRGGLQLGIGREFVCGVPVRIGAGRGAPVRHIHAERHAEMIVPPGEDLVIDAAPQVAVTFQRDEAATAEARIVFVDAPVAEPAIAVRVDPPVPTVRDLLEGRLTIDLSGRRNFTDVPVGLALMVPGQPVSSASLKVRLPCRLSRADGLDAIVAAVGNLPRPPSSARLSVDYGIDRLQIALAEPVPSTQFAQTDGNWQAFDPEDGEPVQFRVVDVARPFDGAGTVRSSEPAAQNVFRLLAPEGGDPHGGLVVGPHALRSMPAIIRPAAHRRFERSGDAPGLKAEIAAWIAFSAAEGEHVLAAAVARQTAAAAERAIVTTLCGEAWSRREGEGLRSPASALVAAAREAVFNPLGVKEELSADEEAELPRFITAFEPRIAKIEGLREVFAGAAVDDGLAEALDLAAEEAWSAVDAARVERGLPALDLAPGGAADDWTSVCVFAADMVERRDLAAMIRPRPLADALLAVPYAASAMADVAVAIDRHRKDFGTLRRSARRLTAEAVENGLNLFLRPEAFALTDWAPLAAGLLEDRMTSRAIRYAALRIRGTAGA